jgi:hypothetical protein
LAPRSGDSTEERQHGRPHRSSNHEEREATDFIILGNAGLVTIVAALVASFSQVTGYGWFFIRLAMIVVGIFLLYGIIIRSKAANSLLERLRNPLMKRITIEAPLCEEILHIGGKLSVNLVTIRKDSKHIGVSLGEVAAIAENIDILGIDRISGFVSKPRTHEKIEIGDRILVYGSEESMKSFVG